MRNLLMLAHRTYRVPVDISEEGIAGYVKKFRDALKRKGLTIVRGPVPDTQPALFEKSAVITIRALVKKAPTKKRKSRAGKL